MKKILLAILSISLMMTLFGCESGMEVTPSPVTPDAEEPVESVTPGETVTTDSPEEETASTPPRTMFPFRSATGADPTKEYGLVFYLGDSYIPQLNGIYSIAPAGTEDWVYLDIPEERCERDVDDASEFVHAGCCRAFKCLAEVDGSISTKWRLRIEFLPEIYGYGEQMWSRTSSHIWEDVIIVGDDTLIRVVSQPLRAGEEDDPLYPDYAIASATMKLCELCPPEWEEYQKTDITGEK